MKRSIILLATVATSALMFTAPSMAQEGPVLWDIKTIDAKAQRIANGEKFEFYEKLKEEAESLLLVTINPSVVQKEHTPNSGDKHDYMSLSRYTWPDPDSPDGLPYLFLDGKSNPELNEYDRPKLSQLSSSVNTLALVYYISGEQKYADKAISRLNTWFIDPETRMNPHFEYGQIHKGYSDDNGAPAGILDGFSFVNMLDAVALLELKGAMPEALTINLKEWFGELADWMVTSDNGIAEGNVKHNHAVAYDTQLIRVAMYSGRDSIAHSVIEAFPTRRLATHVREDGSMPAELTRSIAFFYSRYNVEHMIDICDMAKSMGIELYSASDNAIDRAIGWLIPYAIDPSTFPYSQINSWDSAIASFARVVYRASHYSTKADEYRAFYNDYKAPVETAMFQFLHMD